MPNIKMNTENTKHTPGPYYLTAALPLQTLHYSRSEFNESRSREMEACIADDAGKIIAFIPCPAAMKFAPVLTAAPDLLEALKNAMEHIPTTFQGCARAAIAKAEGVK